MKQLLRLLLVAVVVLLASCDYDDYEVVLKPEGAFLERVLSYTRMGDSPNAAPTTTQSAVPAGASKGPVPIEPKPQTVEHLNTIYGKSAAADGKKLVYRARFGHETPDDVGGAGRYEFFETPMGSLSSYAERFRGDPDTAGRVARMQTVGDRITGYLMGWLGSELKDQPGWLALRKCLDQDVRHDLKTLGMYAWLGIDCNKEMKDPQQMAVRAALYLAERGYWSADQAPMIAALFSSASDARPALQLLQRWVAGRMGVPATQPVPQSLAFLGSVESIQKSLTTYLSTTADYQQLLEKWRKGQKEQPGQPRPEAAQVLQDTVLEMFESSGPAQSESSDHIKIRLLCGIKPFRSNGEWNDASKSVSWSDELPGDSALPMQCYAFWSRPDDAYQLAHLGKIALQGEPLALYVLGYRAMSMSRQKEWERFLDSLHPGPKLVNQLKAFRFNDEPATTQPAGTGNESSNSAASPAINAILQGLKDQ